jgi:pyruvate/2-oxoglutarate dehydrogenase complex dihydrolipoamide acyltransferase (E2) component
LYVILSQYRYNPMLTNMNLRDSSGREFTVDYSGLKYRTLRFTPKAAQRADSPDPPTTGKPTDRFLAVDYQLLQQAWRALAAKRRAALQGEQGAAPIGESLEATRAAEAQSRNTAALAQEVETLKQQLESIQKQLGNQPTGQGSPNQKTTPPSK